jgi:HD-GYP domain-containing protein (c-di-GMP phosphodiesterase class II)
VGADGVYRYEILEEPVSFALHLEPDNFSTFRVEKLVDNSVTDFDLFINVDQHFILYSGNGYRWNRDELTELLRKGHDTFYIRRRDMPKADMYEVIAKIPQIEKSQAPKERVKTIEQVGAKFVQCLYEGDITEAAVAKAEQIGDSLSACVREDPTCIKYLGGLASHDYYTYYHSIRVATYSVALAHTMGNSNDEQLQQIALGGIFHDIGKKQIPLKVLNKSGPLTEHEWELMRSHPKSGYDDVLHTILNVVPREIILHHHEKLNGTGYPDGLAGRDLLPEVKIATLADIFDALTSSRSYQTRRTRYEGLDFIKHRLLKEEIWGDAFKALIECLAK